jgi:ATP-binding cassette subfamily F protein uup
MPAKMLSGGERNRLLLARLFLQPANVLVLDEPTNDLDAETLELLEELLLEYAGTLLLVSHDRAFLDNVVTSTLVFEGDGRIAEYTGGYEDWIRQRDAKPTHFREILAEPKPEVKPASRLEKGPKFLKREQRELEELPALIEKMEVELSALNASLWDPAVYQKQPGNIPQLKTELAVLEERIKHGYTRWEQLEAKRKACAVEG